MRDISGWLPADREAVLCAVSGGLDSMVLLDILRDWTARHGGSVTAAHYNHHLRPSASRDETFVRGWCAEHGIAFVSGGGDVKAYAASAGLSIEEAARKLRYAFLRREASARGIARIYVAHHAGDNAETILWNFIRGTGLRGLAGMAHEQGDLVRPLLDVTREEIEAYAQAHSVPHVEDETNADPGAASRNLLRLEVMPLLRKLNPRAEEHLRDAGKRAATLQAFMEADAKRYMERVEAREGFTVIPARDILRALPETRPVILLSMLEGLEVGRKDFGAVHLQAVLHLLDGGRHADTVGNDMDTTNSVEKRVNLPHGVTASAREGWLILETRPAVPLERELPPGIPVRWGRYELTLTDAAPPSRLPERVEMSPQGDRGGKSKERGEMSPQSGREEKSDGLNIRAGQESRVTVRPVSPRERLTLQGTRGARTLKRLCVDRRISLTERDALPALYVDGRLAAVWKLGVDSAFTPDGTPCRFVRVRDADSPFTDT